MAQRATQKPACPMAHGPRLLPWTTSDGRPCYLSTDGQGYLTGLADSIESIQLSMGDDLLTYARDTIAPNAKTLSATEYRWLARRLTEALSDALRIADSRGPRLPEPEEVAEDA